MTNDQKIDEMYKAVMDIKVSLSASEARSQQLRVEVNVLNAKVEEHEKTQAKAYALFAVAGVVFTGIINWLFKHL